MVLEGSKPRFVVDNIDGSDIRPSAIHGHGLFATREVAGGAVLAELDGQHVAQASFEAFRRAQPYGGDSEDLCMEWNALSVDELLLRPFRTKYGFINHSRTPNLELAHGPLRLVAARRIAAGEEFTLDYRREPLPDSYLREASFL